MGVHSSLPADHSPVATDRASLQIIYDSLEVIHHLLQITHSSLITDDSSQQIRPTSQIGTISNFWDRHGLIFNGIEDFRRQEVF